MKTIVASSHLNTVYCVASKHKKNIFTDYRLVAVAAPLVHNKHRLHAQNRT